MASRWTDADREQALAVLVADGLAAAHRATSVPKATICDWADAAGIDRAAISERSGPTTVEANATRNATIAQRKVRLANKLADIAEDAAEAEHGVVLAVRSCIRPADDPHRGELLAAAKQLFGALSDGPSLSQLVGSRTRAIHDLQLLDGGATERAGSEARIAGAVAEGQAAVTRLRSVG